MRYIPCVRRLWTADQASTARVRDDAHRATPDCSWAMRRVRIGGAGVAVVLSLLAGLLLTGCAAQPPQVVTRTVEVAVPTPVWVDPPAELLAPIPGTSVDPFVPLDDPRAVVGVTEPGVRELSRVVEDLGARVDAWREWSAEAEATVEAGRAGPGVDEPAPTAAADDFDTWWEADEPS